MNERPAVVDEIANHLNLRIYALLGIVCLVLIFDVAANARNSEAIDLWGMLALAAGVVLALLVKVTRDFRSLRKWTLPLVSFLLRLFSPNDRLARQLESRQVRRAFGLDD